MLKKYVFDFVRAACLTASFAVAADILRDILPTLSWTFAAATLVAFTFSAAAFMDLTDHLNEAKAKSQEDG